MTVDIRTDTFLPHPREQVWRALTDPALLAEWLMPNDFQPRVGHSFTFRTDPAPGFDGVVDCEVLELRPPELLRIRWRGGPAMDTTVTWQVVPEGRGCRLLLTHEGFDDTDPAQRATWRLLGGGWRGHLARRLEDTLDTMAARLSGGRGTMSGMDIQEVNRRVIEQFRAGGEVDGMHRDRLVLLTTVGARTGRRHTAPMMFHPDGDRTVVIASNRGAPRHPDWYLNLVADPHVVVEIGDDVYDAVATTLTGADRDRVWADIVAADPFFTDHQAATTRQIPLVVLNRVAPA